MTTTPFLVPQDYMESIVSKAHQRMYIVKTFLFFSSVPLASMLFKSFIVSLLTYCLPILYTNLYAKDKKSLRYFFKEAQKLGIEDAGDIDKRSKTLIMHFIHDNEHFINDFLEQCPIW